MTLLSEVGSSDSWQTRAGTYSPVYSGANAIWTYTRFYSRFISTLDGGVFASFLMCLSCDACERPLPIYSQLVSPGMQLIIDLAKSWDIEIEYRALPDHAAESATSAPAYVN